jgi:hypothetical protein
MEGQTMEMEIEKAKAVVEMFWGVDYRTARAALRIARILLEKQEVDAIRYQSALLCGEETLPPSP